MTGGRKSGKQMKKKGAMKPFSMKMSDDDTKKLDQIRHYLNLDSYASVIRKMIRDYKIDSDN